jgi:hypothetical protein
MALFPSNAQAQNEMLIRVPMPAPVQKGTKPQQQPVQEQQVQAEGQQPVREQPVREQPSENDTRFKRVQDTKPHTIIIPYFDDTPKQARQYETLRAPEGGLIDRGLYVGGGQFTPNSPPNQPTPTETITPAPKASSKKQKLLVSLKEMFKNHKN